MKNGRGKEGADRTLDLLVQPVDLFVSLVELVTLSLQLLVQGGRGPGRSLFFLSATETRRQRGEGEENEPELGVEKLDLFVHSTFVPVGLFGVGLLEADLLLKVRLLLDEDLVGCLQLFDGAVEIVDALLLVGVLVELIFEQVELLFELLRMFVQLDVLQEIFVVSLLQHHDQPGLVVHSALHLAQLRLLFRRDAAKTRDDRVGRVGARLFVRLVVHRHCSRRESSEERREERRQRES